MTLEIKKIQPGRLDIPTDELTPINPKYYADWAERVLGGYMIMVCGDLELDLTKPVLRYKDKQVQVAPDNREVKMLATLMRNGNRLVTYSELARAIYRKYTNPINGDVSESVKREVQDVKKYVVTLLLSVGMPRKEIGTKLIWFKNSGYKLSS